MNLLLQFTCVIRDVAIGRCETFINRGPWHSEIIPLDETILIWKEF